MEEIIKGEWFTANRLGNDQFDRIQTADEDAKIKREIFGDVVSIGVEYGVDSFKVVKPLAGLNVIVKKGMAFAYGYPGYTTGDVTLSISPNTDPSLTRIDVIVMRANFTTSGRVSKLLVIEGTPGAGAPPIVKNLTISLWDTKLAEVTILPSQSTIDEEDIKDFRKLYGFLEKGFNEHLPGIVFVADVATTFIAARTIVPEGIGFACLNASVNLKKFPDGAIGDDSNAELIIGMNTSNKVIFENDVSITDNRNIILKDKNVQGLSAGDPTLSWVRTNVDNTFHVGTTDHAFRGMRSYAFNEASNRTQKENITLLGATSKGINFHIDKLKEMKINQYKLKGTSGLKYGFIIDELMQVDTNEDMFLKVETVDEDGETIAENGAYSLGSMCAFLTKVIQEQQVMIDDLKSDVEVLKQQ